MSKETLSIRDDEGTLYEFKKPDFKCELLKIYNNKIIGYVVDRPEDEAKTVNWNLEGRGLYGMNCFNLNPHVVTEWWKPYTDGEPFEILVVDKGNCLYIAVEYDKLCFLDSMGNEIGLDVNLRLATKDERNGLGCGE